MHTRGNGRWERRRKIRGEEIWYGVFEMQTSKYGKSALTKSPMMISSFLCSGLGRFNNCTRVSRWRSTHFPWTRFVSSAAILGSISTAVTCFAFSRILTVRFPVPGPTSRTLSVGLRLACTIGLLTTKKKHNCSSCKVPFQRYYQPVSSFWQSARVNDIHTFERPGDFLEYAGQIVQY